MDHNKIINAVKSLKAKYPHMAVDYLESNKPDTVDKIEHDVFRNLDQVEECMQWLAACQSTKSFTQRYDTYTYKHEAERHVGHWVSHMSLLVAVELSGIDMKPDPTRPWAGLLKLGANRPGRPHNNQQKDQA